MKKNNKETGAIGLMLVIAVLIVSATLLVLPQSRATLETTKSNVQSLTRLADTRDSLLGFAVINNRLPRPAAADGTERSAPCSDVADCTGSAPWVVLGTDAGQYSVDPGLANSTITCDSGDPAAPMMFPVVAGNTTISSSNSTVTIPNKLICTKLKRTYPGLYTNCTCG